MVFSGGIGSGCLQLARNVACETQIVLMQMLQFLLAALLEIDEARIGGFQRAQQLIELQMNRMAVAVLRVLDQEHHRERDDGCPIRRAMRFAVRSKKFMERKRAARRWGSLPDADAQQRGGLDVVHDVIREKEKAMYEDDSLYWGLFENRPAKERTSPLRAEEARRELNEGKPRRQWKAPRAGAGERVKC